jgi:hypothetical protein
MEMLSNLLSNSNKSAVEKCGNELHTVENLNDLKLRISRNYFSGNQINGLYDTKTANKKKQENDKLIKCVSDCTVLDESLSFDCNCDNKITNHCKSANKPTNKIFYSKLYDQSLNQINVSNKIERKRNINMLLNGAGEGNSVGDGSENDNRIALNSHCSDPKKMRFDSLGGNESRVDGQVGGNQAQIVTTNNEIGKDKMYQVCKRNYMDCINKCPVAPF